MTSLARKANPLVSAAHCTADELVVSLADGRVLTVPLAWFPRLARATPEELADFELLGNGEGIHWRSVDEDVSITSLLRGHLSLEVASAKA